MPCRICESKNLIKKFEDNHDILQCQDCGIKYIYEFPSQEKLNKFYDEDYLKKKKKEETHMDYLDNEKTHRKNAKRFLKIMEEYRDKKSPKSLLDYGCAYGFLMSEAKKMGWQTIGMDISKECREYIKNNFDLHATATLDELNKIIGFDKNISACAMIATIEHLINPLEALKEINSLLSPNGLILISAIRYDGFWPVKWRGIEHPFCFSKRSLELILKKCGFEIIFCRNNWSWFAAEEALNIATNYWRIPFNNKIFVWICKKLINQVKIPNNELICLAKKKYAF